MHARFYRRLPTELVYLRKRLPTPQNLRSSNGNDDDGDNDSNDGGDGEGNAFTAPITITVTEVSQPTVTPPPVVVFPTSSSATSTASTSSTTSTMVTSQIQINATSTQSIALSSSTQITIPSPTIIIGNNTASGHNSTDSAKDQSDSSTRPLSAGATAGIVIACLLLLIVAVVFGLRHRFVRNRLRTRGIWARTRGINPTPEPLITPYEPKEVAPTQNLPIYKTYQSGETSPGVHFGRAQADAMSSRVPVPPLLESLQTVPASYGTEALPNPFEQRRITTIASPAALSPRLDSAATPDMMSPFGSMVKCTFIPTLPDELSIVTGETIRVVAEYDDGWALCFNGRGEQGMAPLACLDRGFNSTSQQVNYEYRESRRVSSLPANARYARRN